MIKLKEERKYITLILEEEDHVKGNKIDRFIADYVNGSLSYFSFPSATNEHMISFQFYIMDKNKIEDLHKLINEVFYEIKYKEKCNGCLTSKLCPDCPEQF